MSKRESIKTDPAKEQTVETPVAGDAQAPSSETVGFPDQDSTAVETADEMARLGAELSSEQERSLRVQAELENFRRRSKRELEDTLRHASAPILRDLLPVLDNVGRAIEAAESSDDAAGLLEGFKMVAKQLEGVLEKHLCTRIESLGEQFDPNLHQAISQQPSREHEPNTIVNVTQDGFRLHDRVLRPSQVIVAIPDPEA